MATKSHFINNEFIEGSSKDTYTVYNPATDALVGNVNLARETEVDAAVKAARAASLTFPENAAELSKAEMQAMGIPSVIMDGRFVSDSAQAYRYYGGWADKIEGQTYPVQGGMYRLTTYEPFGVCAGIGAWNTSLVTMGNKVEPALAAGNTFIYNNSKKSPYGMLVMARLFKEAGFPPGVINILTGDGVTGALMSSHMDIDKISFTGSGPAGRKVAEAANGSNLKKVTLELGGQACIASSRLFVHSSIADKFIEGLKEHFRAAEKRMGDPSDPSTMFGPLADSKQLERVLGLIETGKTEAELLVGGGRKGKTGTFVQPTVFLNPGKDSTIYKEEIFGPVLVVLTFETEEEAIQLANDTSYGLSASIYTGSASRALRIAGEIKAGTIGINGPFRPDLNLAFGGYKPSGIGRAMGKEGLMPYMQVKSIRLNMEV